MAQRALEPPHSSVQIMRLSWKGGQKYKPVNCVLNRPSSINVDAIDRLPQLECNVLLDEFPIVVETRKAVQQQLLSSGKAPDADAIPAEVYKAGGLPMAEILTELFHCMWRKEAIQQEYKDTSIINL